MTQKSPSELPSAGGRAIVLAGGLGTRLKSVLPGCPKPMVPVLGRPFLDYLVDYLIYQGIQDLVISTGHLGDQIEAYFAVGRADIRLRCVQESTLLGTGGALAFVSACLHQRDHFLAVNGDSMAPFRLADLQVAVKAGADAAMVGVRVQDTGRFGSLKLGSDGTLIGFREKENSRGSGWINAGIYFLNPALLPERGNIRPASIERDYFPLWLEGGKRIAVVPSNGPFIDIGTPESLAAAADFIRTCGLFPGTRPKG
jgi:D-glycero-alpha-D-manno-heptose 1-phosphate guanylyltransferase